MRMGCNELRELKRFGRDPDYLEWKNGVQVPSRRGLSDWGDWHYLYKTPWRELLSLRRKGLMEIQVEKDHEMKDSRTILKWKARTSPSGKAFLDELAKHTDQLLGKPE